MPTKATKMPHQRSKAVRAEDLIPRENQSFNDDEVSRENKKRIRAAHKAGKITPSTGTVTAMLMVGQGVEQFHIYKQTRHPVVVVNGQQVKVTEEWLVAHPVNGQTPVYNISLQDGGNLRSKLA